MKIRTLSALVVLVLAVALAGWLLLSSPQQDDATLKVRLTWLDQAQFAGVYVAEDQGFYEDAGLDVSVSPGGIEYPSIKMVAAGTDDIGLTSADQILIAREKGIPVVALAAMYQKSPVVLFSLKSSGITRPEDLRGKRIGFKYGDNTEVPLRALLRRFGIGPGDYEEVAVGYDATLLINGTVDVLPGFAMNEPLALKENGYELNEIYLSDYGINFYADVLFTRADVLEAKGEAVRKFVAATLQGYSYAIDHPDDAVAATLRRNREGNRTHERGMLEASIPLWRPAPNAQLGMMSLANWASIQRVLLETAIQGGSPLLQRPQDLRAVINPSYLSPSQ
ncbi:MAG TPA: ABC transporter substrate-binding protein [Croceibacterium sp.]|nr:ABC transporter substrate-binding protein [Croceibacterium sp.]